MPWYAAIYLAALVALGVYSFYDDRRSGRGGTYLTVDAVVTFLWVYMTVAYYHPAAAAPLGRGCAALFLMACAWTAADASRELRAVVRARPESDDPELSESWNLWIDRGVEAVAVAVGVVAMLPAMAAGAVTAARVW